MNCLPADIHDANIIVITSTHTKCLVYVYYNLHLKEITNVGHTFILDYLACFTWNLFVRTRDIDENVYIFIMLS